MMLPVAPPFPEEFSSFSSSEKKFFIRSNRRNEDPNYGRPPKGSRTEERALAAQVHIQQEVRYLCEIIKTIGTEVETSSGKTYEIRFKQLFDFYTNISSKLVGILIRARKHGYVEFDNERQALFQNQDDQVKITLVQMPKDC